MLCSRVARVHARVAFAATALALLAGLAAPAAAAPPPEVDHEVDHEVGHAADEVRLVVDYADEATAADITEAQEAADVAPAAEADALEPLGVGVVAADADEAADVVAALEADPAVESVERDVAGTLDAGVIERLPDDRSPDALAAHRLSQLPAAWARTTGHDAVVIGVVDSGFDVGHRDLAGRLLPGWDVLSRSRNVAGPPPAQDAPMRHGTGVVLVAAAAGDDGWGGAGACWRCRVLPVSVATPSGRLWMSNVAEGIVHAVDAGVDIVSVSISSHGRSSAVLAAVRYAKREGVLVVASAGNESNDRRRYPAAYDEVLGVAAADNTAPQRLHPTSSHGSWVSLAAPYQQSVVRLDGGPTTFKKTSAATPVVAGTAALLKSVLPDLSAAQLRTALQSTAVPIGDVAHGRLDAAAALRSVMGEEWTTSVLPAAPTDVTAVETPTGIDVGWAHDSEWPADEFEVVIEPGNNRQTVPGTARSASVPGLFVLSDLTITVTPRNAAGAGPSREINDVVPLPPDDGEDEEVGPKPPRGPFAEELPAPPRSGRRSAFLGDWDGDGVATPGWFVDGHWYLRNTPISGGTEVIVQYGAPGDLPVVGDWDGDGADGIGVRRGTELHLSDTVAPARTVHRFAYGIPGDRPLAGDWDGDGRDSIAVRRGNLFYPRHTNAASSGYSRFAYGVASDVPVAGDWDGDGRDTVGVYRAGTWFLAHANTAPTGYRLVQYGRATDLPVAGPQDPVDPDGVGAVRASEWWLRSARAPETLQRITF